MSLEAVFSNKFIEEYSNYKKEDLYSRSVEVRDKTTLKVVKKTKVTFTDEFEDLALMWFLHQESVDVIQDENYRIEVEFMVTSQEYIDANKSAYDYFNVTKEAWDELEHNTQYGLNWLTNKLAGKVEMPISLCPHSELVDIVKRNFDEVDDDKARIYLGNFMSLEKEKQKLLIHNISMW